MEIKTVTIRCEHCGGTMTVDDSNSSVLMCPYCGSKELMRESDKVKIVKIQSDTQREIELKKLELENRERKRRMIAKTILKTISILLGSFVALFIVFAVVGLIYHM